MTHLEEAPQNINPLPPCFMKFDWAISGNNTQVHQRSTGSMWLVFSHGSRHACESYFLSALQICTMQLLILSCSCFFAAIFPKIRWPNHFLVIRARSSNRHSRHCAWGHTLPRGAQGPRKIFLFNDLKSNLIRKRKFLFRKISQAGHNWL